VGTVLGRVEGGGAWLVQLDGWPWPVAYFAASLEVPDGS
jgi:hypothetical protein